MSIYPMVKEIIFNGPDGRLEGKYVHSSKPNAPIALIMHPHPLHGGTMNNKVVHAAFHALVALDFSVLRFNFRGVGKSSGVFDHGTGELMDAAAALDWLQLQCPDASSCWLVGFSFGSWIALQLLMRRPEAGGFVAISPPASSYDFTFLTPCPAPGLIVQGTKDDIAPEAHSYNLYEKLSKQKNVELEFAAINNADHFFTNQLDELKQVISDYIKPKIIEDGLPRRTKRDRRRKSTSPLDMMMVDH